MNNSTSTRQTRRQTKNHFSIFHPCLKSHLRSKIVRISWKFGELCKMSQIIIIYEKKILKNFPPTQNGFFRFKGLICNCISLKFNRDLKNFTQKIVIKKYPAERPKSTGSWIFFTDKSRILLITLLQNVRNKKANILR